MRTDKQSNFPHVIFAGWWNILVWINVIPVFLNFRFLIFFKAMIRWQITLSMLLNFRVNVIDINTSYCISFNTDAEKIVDYMLYKFLLNVLYIRRQNHSLSLSRTILTNSPNHKKWNSTRPHSFDSIPRITSWSDTDTRQSLQNWNCMKIKVRNKFIMRCFRTRLLVIFVRIYVVFLFDLYPWQHLVPLILQS